MFTLTTSPHAAHVLRVHGGGSFGPIVTVDAQPWRLDYVYVTADDEITATMSRVRVADYAPFARSVVRDVPVANLPLHVADALTDAWIDALYGPDDDDSSSLDDEARADFESGALETDDARFDDVPSALPVAWVAYGRVPFTRTTDQTVTLTRVVNIRGRIYPIGSVIPSADPIPADYTGDVWVLVDTDSDVHPDGNLAMVYAGEWTLTAPSQPAVSLVKSFRSETGRPLTAGQWVSVQRLRQAIRDRRDVALATRAKLATGGDPLTYYILRNGSDYAPNSRQRAARKAGNVGWRHVL